MESCSVCYSSFSSEDADAVPRRLPCDHVACTQCLRDCFEEASERRDPGEPAGPGVRCPECFTLFIFESVEAVPVCDIDAAAAETGEGGTDDGLGNGEGGLGEGPAQAGGSSAAATTATAAPSSPAKATSKFAAFVSANKAESHIPTFGPVEGQEEEGGDADGEGEDGGRVCKVHGCKNRAVGNVAVCALHTKREGPAQAGGSSAAATTATAAPSSPAKATSKFAAFVSANKAESHIPTFGPVEGQEEEGGDADGEGEDGGRVCKVHGCNNRAVGNVAVCALHTKRLSVVSVSAMVHKFKDTKLSSVALKSDKVEVNRGGVAGAGEAGFDPHAIGERFRRQERLELGEAVALIEAVKNIFREEDNMVELEAPVMVVGDVHGQYFDLLNILKRWRPDRNLLFLGDYVDRGQFSCEVILHLFALKLRHPGKVFLIRGNHECSSVSAHFGFKEECKMKYGLTVYYRFLLAFQTMPICALILTNLGRIFGCHGGISPDIKRLSDIEEIDRFAEPEMEGPLCDMLWADPLNEDDSHKLTDDEYQQFLDTDYVTNQVRGCSYMFGYHAVQRFLRENRLMYMVRAHEVQEEGFRSHFPSPVWALAAAAAAAEDGDFSDEDSDLGSEEEEEANSYDQVLADTSRHLNPTVLTVFSAPNYCDRYRNKAAVLHIERPGYYTVNLLEAEPHPTPVRDCDVNVMQVLATGNTCPYMPTTFRDFLKVAVELGRAVKPTSTNTSTVTEDLAAAAAAAGTLLPESERELALGDGDAEGAELNDNHDDDDDGSAAAAAAAAGTADACADADAGAGGMAASGLVPPPPPGPAPAPVPPTGGGGGGGEEMSPPRRPPRPEHKAEGGNGAVVEAILPSFAPKVRRGPSRMTSAPVLGGGGGGSRSSSFGSAASRRRRRSSGGSSVGSGASLDLGNGGRGGRNSSGKAGGGSAEGEDDDGGGGSGEAEEDSDEDSSSFFGVMSSFSRRSMRGLGLLDVRSSSPGVGRLTRQNTWSVGAPKAPVSEAYRKAHARDGINEMHPEILNRRISSQETGAMEASRASILSASTASVTPKSGSGNGNGDEFSFTTLEDLLFGPRDPSGDGGGGGGGSGGGGGGGGGHKKTSTAPGSVLGEGQQGGGDDDDASPAPASRDVRRQFSLDMNVGSPKSRMRDSRSTTASTKELAALMSNTSISQLAGMDGDVEVDIDPTDAENDAIAVENGSIGNVGGSTATASGLNLSPFNSNWSSSQPRSRDASFEAEGMMTPSPRSRKGSVGGESPSPSPSQILFTHEEIVVLKLLFSLFDRGGKNFITREDIIAYAEEGGDFAQLKEVDAFMEAIDADTDGKVGLSDYINFAARLKGIHLLQQQMTMGVPPSESFDDGTPATLVTEPAEPPSVGEPVAYGE
eukprot:g13131.t1